MNGTLTGLGIALVVALVTALIGPFFIDWNDHREAFEAQASHLLGVPVKVLGEVEARILPSPRIRFDQVVAGDEWAASRLTAESFELDIALMPMLAGEFRVTSLRVEGADLQVSLAADGEVMLPVAVGGMSRADLDAIAITDIEVRNSRIAIADPAANQKIVIEKVGLQGEASSLAGPMKFDATGTIHGRDYSLHAATGRFETSGAGRVKLAIASPDAPDIALDGGLLLAKKPRFEGTGSIVQTPAAEGEPVREPWRIAGEVIADVRRLDAAKVEFDYGEAGRELRLTGGLGIVFGPKASAEVTLQGRQIDLDRALGRDKDAPPLPPAEVLAALAGRFPAAARPDIPLRVVADIGNVGIGGDFVQGFQGAIVSMPGGWTVDNLVAKLPGNASASLSGAVMAGEGESDGLRFSGPVRIDAPNVPALMHWVEGLDGERPAIALKALKLDAALTARVGAFAFEDLAANVDGAEVKGRLAFTDMPDARDRIEARLNADMLDLDALDLARLSRLTGISKGADIDLTLRAAKLKYVGVAWSGVDADLSATHNGVDIRRLAIADLGGARIAASGRLAGEGDQPSGRLEARVDARKLDGLVSVLRASALPPSLIDALDERADVIAPAAFTAVLASSGGTTTGASVDISGMLGGTAFELEASAPRLALAGDMKARLTASSGDTARLFSQLGIPAISIDASGSARLEASLTGDPQKDARLDVDMHAGNDSLVFKGRAADSVVKGRIDAVLDDAGRYVVLFGRAPPASLPQIPLTAGGDLSASGKGFEIGRIAALVQGRAVEGHLSYDGEAGLGGELKTASLGLAELAGMALGPLAIAEEDASGWPRGALGPGMLKGLEGRIAVRTDRLDITSGQAAGKTSFNLVFGRNEFAVQDISAAFAGGTATGSAAIRRAGGDVSFAVRLAMKQADLSELVWHSGGGPAATGRIDLTADMLGTGKTIAAVVENLTGSGSFTIHDAALGAVDAGAFERTLIAVEAGTEPAGADDIARRFGQELAMADLDVSEISSAFTIASGIVRISNAAMSAPLVNASASGTLNLKTGAVDAQMTMRPKVLAELSETQTPQVDLLLKGKWSAPARSAETTAFANVLAVRAVEREIERVEKMEAERREREAKAAEEAALRKLEEEKRAAEEAEAARLKAIREATGEVPLGALPPPIEIVPPKKPAPSAGGPSRSSDGQSPLDFLRRQAVPEASR